MDGNAAVPPVVIAGRYVIERELGHGGSAMVHLARDQRASRQVAVKLLRPELVASLAADRFLKEIRLSQELTHPRIVPVLDSGVHDQRPFLVLPVMEGGSLRERLKRELQLPVDVAVAITRAIAGALAHAHERGLIHRDVKPENILFSGGEACLADFGIARALEHAVGEASTSTSVVLGTALYMSPEQSTGNKNLDARTDVYSLACVAYEMLAGVLPYDGPNAESVLAQKVLQKPRPVQVYRRTISRGVDAVFNRALAVAPADRFQSVTEFAEALAVAAATPPETWEARIRRRRVGAIAAILIAAAALATFAWRSRPASGDAAGGPVIPEGDPRRVAVLFFDVGSPTTPAYVADGITEGLIDALSSVRALHVLSSTAVRRFRGAPLSHDSVSRALKAGTIVTGTIARSGDDVRVRVRLVDAASGQQLSNDSVTVRWADLFALEDKVVDRVGFALRQRLGAEIDTREHRRGTKSLAAWNTAQQADEVMRRFDGPLPVPLPSAARGEMLGRWWREADSLYVAARALDPDWTYPIVRRGRMAARLWNVTDPPLGVQDSLVPQTLSRTDRQLLWVRRAVQLASDALRIDASSADALALRGEARYLLLKIAPAPGQDSLPSLIDSDLSRAVSLRPDNASAWRTRAQFLSERARFSEAADAARRAFQADPFVQQSSVISTAFWSALWAERFDDARKWCALGREHYPTYPSLIQFAECDLTLLGWTGRRPGDAARGWRLVDSIERVSEPSAQNMLRYTWGYRRLMVAAVLARAQLADSARRVMQRVHETPDTVRGTITLPEAFVYSILGERDSAVARLDRALRGEPQRRTLYLGYPWSRPYRDDPRLAPTAPGSSPR